MATLWTAQSARADDLPDVLNIMDDAAAWLVARGQTGQWGTVPLSQTPGFAKHIGAWLADGLSTLAVDTEGRAQAVIVVGPGAPPYLGPEVAHRMAQDALYVYMLGARKTPSSRGAGAFLMRHAENAARATECAFLRLDCWAGSPGLLSYYAGLGFTPCGTFHAGDWPGALYEKSLNASFWVEMAPGVRRRTLCAGAHAMQMEVEFQAGVRLPEHTHTHEQIVHVLSGCLRLTVEGVLHTLKPGQSFLLPGGVAHRAEAQEPTRVLDTFSPPREDLLAQDVQAAQARRHA